MKKNVLSVLVLTGLLVSLVLSGCNGSGEKGEVITEKKDVSNFTTLDIGSAFEVDITRADTYSLTIYAHEDLIDYIEVTQTGTHLQVYLNPKHIFTDFTLGERTLRAEITMPTLFGLEVSGATKGTVTGFSSTANLALEVSGASSLELENITAGNVRAEVTGASSLTGNLTGNNYDLTVSGASALNVSGTGNIMTLVVSGASRADIEALKVEVADTNISGASEAVVFVEQMLDVQVSGASRLYFIGNPTLGETDVSGASTIKHKD